MTGMSCSGKPGTSAFTVAVASGAGAGDSVAEVDSGEAVEPEADVDGVDVVVVDDGVEVLEADGAAEPPGDCVHAEAAKATLTASRANPRD
ncbi:hypothetical protein [Paenarthrobacter nitroguajacolicus]|uniref:hypothetical protein n=1 Tax=Paenarthrobacter nitroguajacolicus TaxID=211146 RepID=UPI0040544306